MTGPSLASGVFAKGGGQSGNLAAVAYSGEYSDLNGRPVLGSAAGEDASVFATSAQGLLASTALQPGAQIPWADVTGKPAFGSAALQDTTAFAPAVHTHTASQISDASANGRSLITAADYAAMRVLLQLVKGTSAGNIPVLDGGGKLDTSILPALAITETFVVNSQSAMLALAAQTGDVAIRTDLNKTFILSTNNPGTLADWKEMLTPTDAVLSVAGLTGAISASALKTALAIAAADITDASANGRSLITAANYAAMRTLLGLVIGTNVQAYDADLAAIAALTPTNGNVITGNGTTWVSQAPSGAALPTFIARDEKASSTDGGAASAGTWQTRTLNTVVANGISGASLSSNQITLPAGTYDVCAVVPAVGVDTFTIRLQNVTDATTLVLAPQNQATNTYIQGAQTTLVGRFTLAGTKTVELQQYSQTAQVSYGFGRATTYGGVAVFSVIKIQKVG